jgi:hypothetical protein
MNKKNSSYKKFDCVEMKHEAAFIINQKTSKMSIEEELAYWKSKIPKIPKRRLSNREKK